jgi:hypothetical protein
MYQGGMLGSGMLLKRRNAERNHKMSILAEVNQKAFDGLTGTVELKSLYAQQENGMFRLDVESVNGVALEDVTGLKSSLSKTLDREKLANKQKKEIEAKFDGIEPDKAREAIAKLEEFASGKFDDKGKAQIEAAVNQFKDKSAKEAEVLKKEIEKQKTEAEKWKAAAVKKTTSTEINGAIAKAGANPNLSYYLETVTKPELQEDGTVKLIIYDKQGNVKLTNKSGSVEPMTIEEHVAELKGIDSFAAFFPGTGASGSGATGGTGGYKPKSGVINISREDAKNPVAYRKARAEAEKAGVPLQIAEV